MKFGPGHDWVRYLGGEVECYRCGARPHWPVAGDHCPIYVDSPERLKDGAVKLTWEELEVEVKRAFDAYGENPLYQCVAPSSLYGRDGRRRTGI